MTKHILLAAAAFALIAAAAVAPAQATLYCQVVKTGDGFAALRAAPEPSARQVARMKTGAEVFLVQEKRNGWEKVRFWPANDRITKGTTARTMTGWVHGKLIEDCG